MEEKEPGVVGVPLSQTFGFEREEDGGFPLGFDFEFWLEDIGMIVWFDCLLDWSPIN